MTAPVETPAIINVKSRADGTTVATMLALTFTTGIVDAVGFLGLDRVFTGNMTGNVVILGMGIARADDLPVLGPALALVAFMLGAALVGRILRHAPDGWSTSTTAVIAAIGLVAAALGAGALVSLPAPGSWQALTASTLLATLMGMQAATARQVGVKDVTTVVVTSTIVGLSAESRLGNGRSRRTKGQASTRFLAISLILLGATVGALLLRWHLSSALFLTAVICLLTALVGQVRARAGTTRHG